jgi:hypothetical protein
LTIRPVEYFHSDEPEWTCDACRRTVKRAVDMSDGRILGLDCAATAMGRPKSRASYNDIELEARRESATIAADNHIRLHGIRPSRHDVDAYQAYNENARESCRFPDHSFQYHCFFEHIASAK